jgi:hypothetical protein
VALSDQDREAMVHGLVGLRRVRGLLPSNPDVELGIKGIKAALGEAVSQRTAARALGIAHPELSKLITDGRLAVTDTSRGRSQVVVDSLVELIEQEGAAPREEPSWKQRRAKREAEAEAAAGEPSDKQAELQRIIRLRALAFHRALARNLDIEMIEAARELVAQWREQSVLTEEQADAWAVVLERPLSDVVAKITDYSPAGDALREKSPFERIGRGGSDPQ